MKKGVSLISLIITIIVIIILAGVTIFSSLDTSRQAEMVNKMTELENVFTFVSAISSRAEAGQIDISGLNQIPLATDEEIDAFSATEGDFSAEQVEALKEYNRSAYVAGNRKYGYFYVTGEQIETDMIPGIEGIASQRNFTLPTKVGNDYLINFTTGGVITKVAEDNVATRGSVPLPSASK